MTNAQLGIILGGLIPAILFGIAGFFQKVSANQNVTLGAHLVTIGLGVTTVGVVIYLLNLEQEFSVKRLVPSFIIGASWGLGMVLVAIAIAKYSAPLSVVAPLYNMNTLVTVVLALVVFAEWKDANLWKLIAGTILIVGGGILVSGSSNPKNEKTVQKKIENPKD